MVDCKWEGSGFRVQGAETDNLQSLIPNPQSLVSLGDKFALASGLMEITYDTGAKVILQGPMTYEVESRSGGYLAVGKLTARMEKGPGFRVQRSEDPHPSSLIFHPLFSVRTPTATVTDLGTEFGVEVGSDSQVAVHVFVGTVQCTIPAAKGVAAETIRLTTGSAVRIAAGGTTVERRQADPSRFAQLRMPQRRPLPLVAFYPFDGDARDHSGNGNHVVPAKMPGVTFVEGFEGRAAHFDASANSYIDLPVDASPTAMPQLTWGRVGAASQDRARVFQDSRRGWTLRTGVGDCRPRDRL